MRHFSAWCLLRPEEGDRSSGTGVRSRESSRAGAETPNLGHLEEQQGFLTFLTSAGQFLYRSNLQSVLITALAVFLSSNYRLLFRRQECKRYPNKRVMLKKKSGNIMGNQFLFLSGAHGSRPEVAQGHHGLPQPGPRVASPTAWAPPARGLRRSATRRTCPRSPPALAGRRRARTREADSEPTHEAARRGSRRPLPPSRC